MKVPLLDLKAQYQTIKTRVLEVTEAIYDSQYFILGPEVESLEKKIAGYCNCSHAVGVSSGTDALVLSLMAACAVAILAPDMPSMMRERNINHSILAKPSIKKPIKVPIWEMTRTGLRPYLSDNLPKTGAPKNCIIG